MVRTGHLMATASALVASFGLALANQGPIESAAAAPPVVRAAAADPRPNIVLVVMDDFSMDLLPTMRHAMEMRRKGASYRYSFVVDSLCCPSRASLLTGQYPHQTGVFSNVATSYPETGPIGGFAAFEANGNLERSVNVRLQESGYTTGFVGKYLNGYSGYSREVLPPGWSWWRAILGNGYRGWGFGSTRVVGGTTQVVKHPAPPASASEKKKDRAYVGRVTARMATEFITRHRADPEPFFLEVAPYGVHSRVSRGVYRGDPLFPPAFRDRRGNCGVRACRKLDARDLPGFADPQRDNRPRYADGGPAPQWRRVAAKPTTARLTRDLRNRAQMAQSIDRLLARVLDIVDRNTYVVLTSDNGFHLGQHRLGRGKGTPFDSDIRVPLLVVGPGVAPGSRREVVSTIDLAPTFEDLAGLAAAPYRSGHSLVPTFGEPNLARRSATFVEHVGVPKRGSGTTTDPDAPFDSSIAKIPSYVAVRTRKDLLVRFDLDQTMSGVDHAWEFYDFSRVPWERTNVYGRSRFASRIAELTHRLDQFDACSASVRDAVVPDECRNLTQ
jgi:N-acetylglucosamine-6-sulfatase